MLKILILILLIILVKENISKMSLFNPLEILDIKPRGPPLTRLRPMLRMNSRVYCVDSTGVLLVKVIQVIGNRYKRDAVLGSKVLVSVRALNIDATFLKDEK